MKRLSPINKDRFSRRAFIKGLGISPAFLPLIHAERALAQGPNGAPKRFFALTFGNGVRPNFYPSGNDFSAPFGKSIAPLEPFKPKMIMPIGLDYKHILDDGYKYDGHFTYCATLTGTREKKSESRRATAASIDQMISDNISKKVQLKSPMLTLGIRSTGDGCSVSWRSAGVQNPAAQQAMPVFSKLFTGDVPTAPMGGAPMIDLTLRRRKSVLDFVSKELTAFQTRLGTEDRIKIEQHTVSLRDLEKRLVTPVTGGGGGANCGKPAIAGTSAELNGRAMFDIVAMAFRCDLNRVATITISDDGGGDGTSFPWVGSGGDFHAVAHASNDAQMTNICNWFMTNLANLAKQLDETSEPGGTALDNSVLVSFSNMDEGNSHFNGKIPIVMLGSCGGYFKTNQIIRAPKEAHNKLLASICNAMDLPTTGIGAPQYAGVLPGLASSYGLALAVLAGCGGGNTSTPADAGVDAAVDVGLPRDVPAPDVSQGVDAPSEGGPGACAVTPPHGRLADWRVPDPQVTTGMNAPSYDTSMPGVVVDQVTRLMWQREVPAASYEWDQATQYCACLQVAGQDDWRLPTRIELVSLVDFTRSEPAINIQAFPGAPPVWTWTSTERADDPTFAWFVYFENGYSNHHQKDEPYRVRCVRNLDPPVGSGARYAPAEGGLRDTRTGLTWQVQIDAQLRTWEAAKAHCQTLTTAGGGWRLPSMKELQTLVDDSRAEPSIDPMFGETPLEPFWTSSAVVNTPGSAWRVSFIYGYTYDASAAYEYHTRCVR